MPAVAKAVLCLARVSDRLLKNNLTAGRGCNKNLSSVVFRKFLPGVAWENCRRCRWHVLFHLTFEGRCKLAGLCAVRGLLVRRLVTGCLIRTVRGEGNPRTTHSEKGVCSFLLPLAY